MGITIPLLVWVGISFFILFIFKWGKGWQLYLFLLFTVLFPIVYITYKNSNVYGSWRHILFVYPGMVVLASIGWLHLYKAVKHFLFKLAVASVFLLLLFSPLRFMYMNHPLDYLYFNELAGGLSQAWKQYESDYYTNSIRPASQWLMNNTEFKKMNAEHEVKIVSNMTSSVNYYFKDVKNVKILYSRYYEKNLLDWDYAIYYLGYINEYQLQHDLWPSSDNVYVVYADQAPVGVVLKRANKEDLAGFNASNQGQFVQAVHHFETYLQADPYCVKVNLAMAEALALSGKTKVALQYARLAVALYPDYSLGNKMLGWVQLQDNDNSSAIHSFEKLLEIDTDDYMGWYYLSIAYYNEKQYAAAMNCAERSLAIQPENPDAKKVWELADISVKTTPQALILK
jgi:tetratricopeptide (TPR) repeat protein